MIFLLVTGSVFAERRIEFRVAEEARRIFVERCHDLAEVGEQEVFRLPWAEVRVGVTGCLALLNRGGAGEQLRPLLLCFAVLAEAVGEGTGNRLLVGQGETWLDFGGRIRGAKIASDYLRLTRSTEFSTDPQ